MEWNESQGVVQKWLGLVAWMPLTVQVHLAKNRSYVLFQRCQQLTTRLNLGSFCYVSEHPARNSHRVHRISHFQHADQELPRAHASSCNQRMLVLLALWFQVKLGQKNLLELPTKRKKLMSHSAPAFLAWVFRPLKMYAQVLIVSLHEQNQSFTLLTCCG